MLVPLRYPLFVLHHRNTREAHDFYRDTGVFVINAQGDAWQTFGGRILQSHAPTYRYVLEASLTSLRELFLVYYASVPNPTIPKYLISDRMSLPVLKAVAKVWMGESYYRRIFFDYCASADDDTILKRFIPTQMPIESIREIVEAWTMPQEIENYYTDLQKRMPTLLLFPMPISATWNQRRPEKESHRIHRRFHYPQFREDRYHDPSLKDRPLYLRDTFSNWLVPQQLIDHGPDYLIKTDPHFASVHYIQERNFPPSYRGLVLNFGVRSFSGSDFSFGLGYGVINEVKLFRVLPEFKRDFSRICVGEKIPCERAKGRLALCTDSSEARRFQALLYAHRF